MKCPKGEEVDQSMKTCVDCEHYKVQIRKNLVGGTYEGYICLHDSSIRSHSCVTGKSCYSDCSTQRIGLRDEDCGKSAKYFKQIRSHK